MYSVINYYCSINTIIVSFIFAKVYYIIISKYTEPQLEVNNANIGLEPLGFKSLIALN